MSDPTSWNNNRLFVLSFKKDNDDPTRDSFDMPLVEIIDFNALIDNKPVFDQPVKSKQEAYEKHIKMSRNNDDTRRFLLDYLYHQNYYKRIGINFSRQANTSIPQQINFIAKLEGDSRAVMSFVSGKQQKTILNFSLDLLIVTE